MNVSTPIRAGALLLALAGTACSGAGGNLPATGAASSDSLNRLAAAAAGSSEALWVANGSNVVEFLPSQLKHNGSPAPALVLNSSVFGAPQGVQFDAAGNLWVIDGGTTAAGGNVKPALYEFTAQQLSGIMGMKNVAPTVTIKSPDFVFPQQAVFGHQKGALWVSDNGANAVYVFNPTQLTKTNTAAKPAAILKSKPAFNGPLGIVFDKSNNLYIANNASTTIFKFNAATLPMHSTVTLAPDVVLSNNGESIQGPWGLVFDGKGALWSSNANPPNSLVAFSAAQLTKSGSPKPIITIKAAEVNGESSLSSPNGIAFDSLNDLGSISSVAPFGLAFYNPTQVLKGGSEAPQGFLVGSGTTLNAPAGDTFGPVH